MNRLHWITAGLVTVSLVAVAALCLLRYEANALRSELDLLRAVNREVEQLRAENVQLAQSLPPDAVLASRRAEHAAFIRMEAELRELENSVVTRERALAEAAAKGMTSRSGN